MTQLLSKPVMDGFVLGPERVFPTVDAAVHALTRGAETPFPAAVPATAAPR